MSVNNRKYITSTGILLKQLNEDPSTGSFHHQQQASVLQSQSQMYQQQHHQQQQQQQAPSYHAQSGPSGMNQYHQTAYANMPSYSTPHSNQFQPNLFPNSNTIAAAAAIFSKLTNQYQPQPSVPDIMMLPGSMSQQRWQQKPPKQNHSFKQKHQSQNKKPQNTSAISTNPSSSASSVIDLPETFGLPSNKITKTSHPKYSSSNTSIQSSSSSTSTTSSSTTTTQAESFKTDILVEDKLVSNETNPSTSESKSDDIEIISESYPEQSASSTLISSSMSFQSTALQANTTEDNFKNYLAKNYNSSGQLAVASKPQCNFMSNLACISQILNECDYYNKLKRRKPYSNLKLNKIYSDNEDSDEEEEENENEQDESKPTRVKAKKIIVIDDSNEEMHKPWITPDLIKLIKHRNLLQSKINENNTKLDATNASLSAADADLLKKFKNLRNKVTKLVKKARKDYLAKYIQESKENQTSASKQAENKQQTNLDADLINNLAKNPAPPPSTSTNPTGTPTTTTTSTTTIATSASTVSTTSAKSPADSASKSTNPTVLSLTSQLNSSANQGTFLQNQNNLMMSLYNSYFNQYIQQYQHQQQQAQQLATAAAAKTKDEKSSESTDTGYDVLQKQAAYYAQQQRAIQQQLEQSLAQSAQQLVQEIATMASTKAQQQTQQPQQQQPIVYQQFNHQQQHHLHQHIHAPTQAATFTPATTTTAQGLIVPTQPPNPAVALVPPTYNYSFNNMIVS